MIIAITYTGQCNYLNTGCEVSARFSNSWAPAFALLQPDATSLTSDLDLFVYSNQLSCLYLYLLNGVNRISIHLVFVAIFVQLKNNISTSLCICIDWIMQTYLLRMSISFSYSTNPFFSWPFFTKPPLLEYPLKSRIYEDLKLFDLWKLSVAFLLFSTVCFLMTLSPSPSSLEHLKWSITFV